ncbi:hypothetical protein PENTCL1PPCAC_22936, partial [Pristionchus entomophagus]
SSIAFFSFLHSFSEYPPSVFFILGNEFCERFSFYGMKALLTVYLVTEHHFIPSTAVLIYHLFSCIAYLSPLLGSIAADSYFGRYKVILYVSLFYVCGHALLSFGSLPWLDYHYRSIFDFSGLIVIALSTGGIKPCVSAFAVDQFREDQDNLRAQFFSFFYFSINGGALLAILITPILKSRMSCFGAPTCFPLAFGVPGILMLLALLIFAAGSRSYKKLPPSHSNIALQLFSCGVSSIRKKWRGEKPMRNGDWISLASPEYSHTTIQSLRSFLSVARVFAPIVLFWALFDQKGSTWILLARKLNYQMGGINVIPEQINFLNPLLILILVPIFEVVVYPLARKIVRVTPLRKMATGGILTAISFIMCGMIQMEADRDQPPILLPHQNIIRYLGNVSMLNGVPEGIIDGKIVMEKLSGRGVNASGGEGIIISTKDGRTSFCNFENKKAMDGSIILFISAVSNVTIRSSHDIIASKSVEECGSFSIPATLSDVIVEWECEQESHCNSRLIQTGIGSIQALQIDGDSLDTKILVNPNELSIAWMFPQYVVITMGEVMLSVTGLEFAYSQSTPDIKSVMQALWLMTVFLGNLLDMVISGSHLISDPSLEFFFYAALMLGVMVVFILSALTYTYKGHTIIDHENGRNDIEMNDSR